MEYKILSDVSREHLEMSVGDFLKNDWQLAGGLQVTIEKLDENNEPNEKGEKIAVYYQAVVR